jgi:hypothetical protein
LLKLLATRLASLSLVPLIKGIGYTYRKAQRKIKDVKKALCDCNTLAFVNTYVIPYLITLISIYLQFKKNRNL